MAKTAQCPACGAAVVFKSAASLYAVCEYCRSTLVRHDKDLKSLGRMADLLEDSSPIRLGTEGQYRGTHFAVIGRIQLRYASGVWNEWHVLFDDMRGGWLSDANGEYTISFLTAIKEGVPAFGDLHPEMDVILGGKSFVVTDIEEAACVAGEGELPFAFGAGHAAPVADLRGERGFVTLDYSELPPLVFVGASVPFAAFKFANLRGGQENPFAVAPNVKVKSLNCTKCGGPIVIHDPAIRSVACPSCLTLLDASNDSLAILAHAAKTERIEPRLPLGASGRFGGCDWTVIGFQRRFTMTDGEKFFWDEYLLHHEEQGLRWLTEYNGHWSWVSPVASPPRYVNGTASVEHDGDKFKRFAVGWAETAYVVGEFNWQVQVGERWEAEDFVAPPRMLSREVSEREVTWSLADYLPPEEVAAAFKLKKPLPAPQGVGANQPNPRAAVHRTVCRRFWLLLLLASLMQFVWLGAHDGGKVHTETLTLQRGVDEPVETREFDLPKGARRLTLRHRSNLNNDWLGLDLVLVEAKSGQNWQTRREIGYWSGVEDGESWSEGSTEGETVFRDLPPGRYRLIVDPEFSSETTFGGPSSAKGTAISSTFELARNAPIWGNYVLLSLFLAIFPLITRYRVTAFEARRWSDSDFNPYKAAEGSDSDGGGDD